MVIGYDAKRFFRNNTGLGNYSRDLVRVMRQFYPDNSYLLYTPSFEDSPYKSTTDLDTIRTPKGFVSNKLKGLWRTKNIVCDLVSDKIEIFHGLSGELPMSLKGNGIKSIVTIHDLIFLRYPHLYKPIDRYIYTKKFRYACHQADKIVAISEQTKLDIINFLDVDATKIEVIYQGCHQAFKEKKTAHEKQEIKQKLGLPEEFLLNVGTIEERKNALSIVKAIKDTDIPLVLVGKSTKYQADILEYVRKENMGHRIFFRQGLSMSELATLYAVAKVFVYPSVFEGFGIPIIEALYSGTPVITTNSGVFPEAGGPSSLYVDTKDIQQLRDAIVSILESEDKQSEMRNLGLGYVQKFNDDRIASQWQQLYQQLLE
jgi:glycosyltransferase involved in cell wall biosynthesis